MNVKAAVVLNEAHSLEFVHEEIDARARSANHLREHLLRYFGNYPLWLALFSIPGEQQQRASQTLFGGIKELIYQVLLDSNVPGKHIRDKTVRERMLGVKHATHLILFDY